MIPVLRTSLLAPALRGFLLLSTSYFLLSTFTAPSARGDKWDDRTISFNLRGEEMASFDFSDRSFSSDFILQPSLRAVGSTEPEASVFLSDSADFILHPSSFILSPTWLVNALPGGMGPSRFYRPLISYDQSGDPVVAQRPDVVSSGSTPFDIGLFNVAGFASGSGTTSKTSSPTILAVGTKAFDGGATGTGTTLDLAANWSPDVIPTTTDEALLDNSLITLPSALTLNSVQTFGDLLINSSTLTSISLTGSTTRILTLSGGGGSTAAIAAGGATGDLLLLGTNVTGAVTIGGGGGSGNLNLALGANGNFDIVNSGATANITSTISGVGFSLNKTGAGTLILGATTNTFSGGFTLTSGTVQLGASASLGSGTVTLAGGTITASSGTTRSPTNVLSITGDTTFGSTGAGAITFSGGGTTTGSRNLTFNTTTTVFSASPLTLGGDLTTQGTGGATFSGGIALGGTNRIITGSMTGTLSIGAVTGTGNLTLDANSSAALNVTGSANNVGTILNAGTSSGTTTLSGGVGTNVTGITESSSTSALTISGAITLGSNIAITSTGTALTTISGGITGTHNLTLNANSSGHFTLSGSDINNGGTITNSGSGTGTTTISAVIGTSVTGVTQNSAGSTLALGTSANIYAGGTTISGGKITIGGSGTPLGSGTLTLSGGTLVTTASRLTANALANNVVVTADSAITTTSNTAATLPFSGTLTGTAGTLTIRNDGSATTALFEVRFSGGDYTMSRPIVIDSGAGGGTARLSDFNTSGTTHTYNGIISGTGSFNRSVSTGTGGTTIFNAANTYTGATTVNSGTLLVNGSTSSSSAVTVNNSGSTLGGTGTVGGTVSVSNAFAGGIINPGPSGTSGTSASVGTLTTGAVTLSSTLANTFHVDASGTLTSNWDQLIANGVTLGGTASTLQLSIASGLTFTYGTTYILINNTAATPISGTFNGIVEGGTYTFSGYDFTASYLGGTGNDFTLTEVPEPSTWIGGGLALAAVGFTQRRRLKKRMRVIS